MSTTEIFIKVLFPHDVNLIQTRMDNCLRYSFVFVKLVRCYFIKKFIRDLSSHKSQVLKRTTGTTDFISCYMLFISCCRGEAFAKFGMNASLFKQANASPLRVSAIEKSPKA